MPVPIHYLALHEIFPDFGPVVNTLIAVVLLSGFAGFVLVLPALWISRRRPTSSRRRPPVAIILFVAFMIAFVPFAALGPRATKGETLRFWVFTSFWLAGNGTTLWWLYDRLRSRAPAS